MPSSMACERPVPTLPGSWGGMSAIDSLDREQVQLYLRKIRQNRVVTTSVDVVTDVA